MGSTEAGSGVTLSPDGRTVVVSDFFDKLMFFDAGTHGPTETARRRGG